MKRILSVLKPVFGKLQVLYENNLVWSAISIFATVVNFRHFFVRYQNLISDNSTIMQTLLFYVSIPLMVFVIYYGLRRLVMEIVEYMVLVDKVVKKHNERS